MAGVLQRKMLKHQMKMINSTATFPALVSGFGGGKSETMVMKALKQMFEIENAQIAIYEPTVDLIKKIMYPRFEEILSNAGLVYKLNKSEGIIDIPNIGTVLFRSLENPDRIIGYEVHHSHVDELDTLDTDKAQEAWQKLLGRNRKRIIPKRAGVLTKNTASVYTTPEGYRFVYQRWMKEKLHGYELIQASTYDNPFLPKEYIRNLKESYPEQLIEAYLNGQFVNLAQGTVYPNYHPINNRSYERIQMDLETIHIGMDFNVNHMSAVVAVKRYNKLFVLAEISDVRDTPAMIEIIKDRYDTGRVIVIYPDASGNSSKSVDASKSDISLLRDSGLKVYAPPKNPPVRDRIVSCNSAFKNALNHHHLYINDKECPKLSSNLIEQAYDKNGIPMKINNVDHLPDALGYLVHKVLGVAKNRTMIRSMRF
jgi:hypothetical protein